MNYSQYNLESLLSQLETQYYLAKDNYRKFEATNDQCYIEAHVAAQKKRQAIKDEIIKRFSCLEQRVQESFK